MSLPACKPRKFCVTICDMPETQDIDLRAAINAISDVIQNRPRPLREFDQIYMKAGDMVMQSEMVARWADKKRVAFIGDGDAISVCVAYLLEKKILPYVPSDRTVYLCSGFNSGLFCKKLGVSDGWTRAVI